MKAAVLTASLSGIADAPIWFDVELFFDPLNLGLVALDLGGSMSWAGNSRPHHCTVDNCLTKARFEEALFRGPGAEVTAAMTQLRNYAAALARLCRWLG
ncbi:hypothetical protein [Pseudomonas congelans]|uniref:hypothetical protein n=1 Tax=Pseudomonas congelans TaxID=200452 RepID=UPI0016554E84|nr:hypothetical protein [Pseudomonas congelans]